MSLPAIRERIKAVLAGVSGMGNVHDYERFSADWGKFLALFKDGDDRVNGCMFARSSSGKRQSTLGEKEKYHIFTFRFFRGLMDESATGVEFDDFIDKVEDAFDADPSLEKTCLTIDPDWGPMSGLTGLQVEVIENRRFGAVLCHYAECRLCVIETV